LRPQRALLVAQHLVLRGAAALALGADAFRRALGALLPDLQPLLRGGVAELDESEAFLAAQKGTCACINQFSARRTRICTLFSASPRGEESEPRDFWLLRAEKSPNHVIFGFSVRRRRRTS